MLWPDKIYSDRIGNDWTVFMRALARLVYRLNKFHVGSIIWCPNNWSHKKTGGSCSHALPLSLVLSFLRIYLSHPRQNKRDHDKSVPADWWTRRPTVCPTPDSRLKTPGNDFQETLCLLLPVERTIWLGLLASAICCTLCGNYPFPFLSFFEN